MNKLYKIYYYFSGDNEGWKTWVLNGTACSLEQEEFIDDKKYIKYNNISDYIINNNVKYERNIFVDIEPNHLIWNNPKKYTEVTKEDIKNLLKLDKFNKSFKEKLEK